MCKRRYYICIGVLTCLVSLAARADPRHPPLRPRAPAQFTLIMREHADFLVDRYSERKEIAKSYKLGFAALRYYADNQRASLLLAKNDGRLWLLLKGLFMIGMPVELREKIVDFAFFGKDAPERKANKAVEDKSEEEDEDESEERDSDFSSASGFEPTAS